MISRLSLAVVLLTASNVVADPGHPVAVRWWGQGMVSIETYWNLHLVIDPHSAKIGYRDPQLSADLVLVTHEHFDHNNVEIIGGEPIVVRGLDDDGAVEPMWQVLDRPPNAARPTWNSARLKIARSCHAIVVRTIPAWHDDSQGNERGATAMFAVDVDGVRIVHMGDYGQAALTDEQTEALGQVDVLLIPVGGVYTIDGEQAAEIVGELKPRFVVPLHYKTPALSIDLETVEKFVDALSEDALGEATKIERSTGNTLAVADAKQLESDAKTQAVILDYTAWKPEGELAQLLAAKEQACRLAQETFAPLTVEMMNFRPPNGTHTPRWNAEHMMGRELLFFTRAFAERDPAFTPIDLNPKQMPPDYEAAHADWSGAEEARQMERVSDFVRRFAYLLADADLDEPAWKEGWTLRFLLEQMARHYGEHTANVKKKFELAEWPAE